MTIAEQPLLDAWVLGQQHVHPGCLLVAAAAAVGLLTSLGSCLLALVCLFACLLVCLFVCLFWLV
jgi:hypothetical protein